MSKEFLGSLFLVMVGHLTAAMSPGPAFAYVAQRSASQSRQAGVIAALAMGIGASVWAATALLGFSQILLTYTWLYVLLKMGGACFLLWMGFQFWKGASRVDSSVAIPVPKDEFPLPHSNKEVFRPALWLQLSNPKVAIFFGAIFLTLLPQQMPGWFAAVVLAAIFIDEFLWYALVAFVLSTPKAKRAYTKAKVWIDRVTAIYLVAVSLTLFLL